MRQEIYFIFEIYKIFRSLIFEYNVYKLLDNILLCGNIVAIINKANNSYVIWPIFLAPSS